MSPSLLLGRPASPNEPLLVFAHELGDSDSVQQRMGGHLVVAVVHNNASTTNRAAHINGVRMQQLLSVMENVSAQLRGASTPTERAALTGLTAQFALLTFDCTAQIEQRVKQLVAEVEALDRQQQQEQPDEDEADDDDHPVPPASMLVQRQLVLARLALQSQPLLEALNVAYFLAVGQRGRLTSMSLQTAWWDVLGHFMQPRAMATPLQLMEVLARALLAHGNSDSAASDNDNEE